MFQSLIMAVLIYAPTMLVPKQISHLTEQEIMQEISTLRSLDDAVRAKKTAMLASEIRFLTKGAPKVLAASALANLATEGDFGLDVLQSVTTTLDRALQEFAVPPSRGMADYSYTQLAQLSRYEGMKVELRSKEYSQALTELDKVDAQRRAATVELKDIEGKTWRLRDLRGKVVLVNFWATWCPPCRKEMPDLEALYQEKKAKGFVVLAISDESIDKVKPFIVEHKYSFPTLLDPGRKTNDAYAVNGIPKSFIYDRKGKLVGVAIDMRTRRQFDRLLKQAGLD